jgi:hypothetical protein
MKKLTAALAALASSTAFAQELYQGYTCCNLRYEKDWISDANWGNLPMIPAGTPIKVTSYGFNRAAVDIDGKPMRLGHDYGRSQEPIEKWVGKVVSRTNPKAKIDRYPEKIRAAIKAGKVVPGMTREQAIISVGYPPAHRTRSVDDPVWNMWASRAGRYELHWSGKGTLEKIVGNPP